MTNPFTQAELSFRRLLESGKPIAFEDATASVYTPPGFERRSLGRIPREMFREGEIVKAGFRQSKLPRHNCGIKQLWVLTANAEQQLERQLQG